MFFKDSSGINLEAAKIPKAMGRSKAGPSFRMWAGAKFTVILLIGKEKPEFLMLQENLR